MHILEIHFTIHKPSNLIMICTALELSFATFSQKLIIHTQTQPWFVQLFCGVSMHILGIKLWLGHEF